MAVRQYIGARYVTKVYENSQNPGSAEWEAGVTYEPLTLVTYQFSSYLSKKEVPGNIGDPASNPTYWVVTGAYNGQIAQLQQDISLLINGLNIAEAGDITARLQNNEDLYLVEGNYVISDDVTYTGNMIVDKGANIITDANTLTFAPGSSLSAGLYQIFDSSSVIALNSMDVFPEWFGAKNDGVTDSYTAIQKAIDSSTRCNIILQPGTVGPKNANHVWEPGTNCYYVSNTISINKPYTGFQCNTQSAVIYKTYGNVLRIGNFDTTGRLEKITVENILCVLGTDHLNNNGSDVSHYPFYFRRCETGRFTNLRVIGSNNGYVIQGCIGGIFEFLTVTPSIDDTYGRYYWIDNSITNASLTFHVCKGAHASDANGIYGIYIDNAGSATSSGSDLHFIECEFGGLEYGVKYDNTNGGFASNIIFDGCVFDIIYGQVINITHTANPNVRGQIHFNDCWISLLTGTDSVLPEIEVSSSRPDFTVSFVNCHINDTRTDDNAYSVYTTSLSSNLMLTFDDCLFSHAFHAFNVASTCLINNCVLVDNLAALQKDNFIITGNAQLNVSNTIFRQASATATLDEYVKATSGSASLMNVTFLGTYTSAYTGSNVHNCISNVQAYNKVWLP